MLLRFLSILSIQFIVFLTHIYKILLEFYKIPLFGWEPEML